MYFGGSHQIKDLDELQTLLPVLNIDKLIIDMNIDSLLWVPTQDKRQISDMETRWMDIRDKRQETDMEGERMGLICQIEGYLLVYPPVHPGSIGWESVLSFRLTQRRKPLIESTILCVGARQPIITNHWHEHWWVCQPLFCTPVPALRCPLHMERSCLCRKRGEKISWPKGPQSDCFLSSSSMP